MSNEGCILISRSLLDSETFTNEKMLKIWIWLIAKANWRGRFTSIRIGRGQMSVYVERGQLIFGRFVAEDELNIDGSTIYKILKKLEIKEDIVIESNSHYSLITICNYDHWQDFNTYKVTAEEQPSNSQVTAEEQPSNSQVTAEEQPSNTPKQDNTYNSFKQNNSLNELKQDLEIAVSDEPAVEIITIPKSEHPKKEKNSVQKEKDFEQLDSEESIIHKEKTLYQKCMEIYCNFCQNDLNLPAKIDGAEGKALKKIIDYLKKSVPETAPEQEIADAFKVILDHRPDWGKYYSENIKLTQINSNLIVIINKLKNGTAHFNLDKYKEWLGVK